MTRRSLTRFLPLSLVLALCLPGLAPAADSKAHEQYLQAAKLFEQDRYDEAIAAVQKSIQLGGFTSRASGGRWTRSQR